MKVQLDFARKELAEVEPRMTLPPKIKAHARAVWFGLRDRVARLIEPHVFGQIGVDISTTPLILVICQPRLGDNVLSTPVFESLKTVYPQSTLVIAGNRYIGSVFSDCPWVDEILELPGRSLSGWLSFVRTLRGRAPDIVIDLNCDHTLGPALLAALSGARVRLGYNIHGRGIFFTRNMAWKGPTTHAIDEMVDLVRPLGFSGPAPVPRLCIGESARSNACRVLQGLGFDLSRPLIGIHPGGHYATQRWPVESCAACADSLIMRQGFQVIILGGQADTALVERVRVLSKTSPKTHVAKTLPEFFGLLSLLSILVCNNSGPLHCAVAIGIKTVSTMGPTIAGRWWPRGNGHRVIRKSLACIGCNSGVCAIETLDCMRTITVDEVVGQVCESVGCDV